jgi:hypothetical protein
VCVCVSNPSRTSALSFCSCEQAACLASRHAGSCAAPNSPPPLNGHTSAKSWSPQLSDQEQQWQAGVEAQHSLPVDRPLAVGPVPCHVADEVGKRPSLHTQAHTHAHNNSRRSAADNVLTHTHTHSCLGCIVALLAQCPRPHAAAGTAGVEMFQLVRPCPQPNRLLLQGSCYKPNSMHAHQDGHVGQGHSDGGWPPCSAQHTQHPSTRVCVQQAYEPAAGPPGCRRRVLQPGTETDT